MYFEVGTWTALPLVDAARHNDAKLKLGRELMILTHDDDDDDVCMSVCVRVCVCVVPQRKSLVCCCGDTSLG